MNDILNQLKAVDQSEYLQQKGDSIFCQLTPDTQKIVEKLKGFTICLMPVDKAICYCVTKYKGDLPQNIRIIQKARGLNHV